jgi:hypothetical protein
MGWNVRVAHGESLDMELTDQGIVPRNLEWCVRFPGESGVDHSVLGHSKGIIAPVKRQVLLPVSDPVSEVGVAPPDGSLNLLAIGVEQELVVIETMALLRGVWAIWTRTVSRFPELSNRQSSTFSACSE